MLEMHCNAIILISTTNNTSSYNFSCLDLIVTTEEKKILEQWVKSGLWKTLKSIQASRVRLYCFG